MGKYQAGGLYGTDTQSLFRTYEPLNLKSHVPEAAKILRERYDTAVEEKSLLDRAMGSIRTISDADAAKVNVAKYDINNNIIGDRKDYENMGKTIKDAATRFLTDHSVLNAIDSYKNWEEGEALKAELTANHGASNVYDFNMQVKKDDKGKAMIDPVTGAPMMETAAETWDSDTKGIYRPKVALRQDLEGRINNLISDVAKDGGATMKRAAMAAGWTPEEQAILNYDMPLYAYTSVGVSKTKIQDLTDELASNLYNSPEGQQFIAANDQLFVNPTTGTTYTEDESKGMLKNMLFNVGSKQIGLVSNMFKITDASNLREAAADQTSPSYGGVLVPDKRKVSPIEALLDEKNIAKGIKTLTEGTQHSWIIKTLVEERFLRLSEPGYQDSRTAKAKKLDEAFKAGNINEAVKQLEPGSDDFIQFIAGSKELREAYPMKKGESNERYLTRLAQVFRDVPQTFQGAYPDQSAAAKLVQTASLLGGNFYQSNGKSAGSFNDAVYQEANDETGIDWAHGSGNVRKSFENSLAALQKGVPEVNKQTAGAATKILTGENAGKTKYTWNHNNDFEYSIVLETVKDQSASFAGIRELENLQKSLVPNKQVVLDIGGVAAVAKNVPTEDANGNPKIQTYVKFQNADGKFEVLTYEDALTYFNDLDNRISSTRMDQYGKAGRHIGIPREVN